MNKIDSKTIEEYQKILVADPTSKIFAVLADAYREMGILEQADNIARRGVSRHPNYAPGLVTWARILIQKNEIENAIKLLKKATELSPDHLLAYQLLGEAYLISKNPKEALRAHKMALFLNPQNERSKQVVKKLESLAADEFEDDVFEMKPLQQAITSESRNDQKKNLEISLSVVDALIVRQEPIKARERLLELQKRYPGNPAVQDRMKLLDHESPHEEDAEAIHPLPSREKALLERKIQKLKSILSTIETYKNHPIG